MSSKKKKSEGAGTPNGPKDTLQPDDTIRPVPVSTCVDWLNRIREGSEDQTSLDCVNEILDIITDYEAGLQMAAQPSATGVVRKDSRTLLCNTCGRKLIVGDNYCGGCGKKIVWNLRGQ